MKYVVEYGFPMDESEWADKYYAYDETELT